MLLKKTAFYTVEGALLEDQDSEEKGDVRYA
jgi:hypothetical protein